MSVHLFDLNAVQHLVWSGLGLNTGAIVKAGVGLGDRCMSVRAERQPEEPASVLFRLRVDFSFVCAFFFLRSLSLFPILSFCFMKISVFYAPPWPPCCGIVIVSRHEASLPA